MRTAFNAMIAAFLVAALAYVVYLVAKNSSPPPQTASAERRLAQLNRDFPLPPFATRVAAHNVRTRTAVAVGEELESNRDPNDIFAYYSSALGKRGWKHCGPMPEPGAVPDNNYFKKSADEAVLQFSPENTGRYVFAFEWGAKNCAPIK
jgi:hypothetical protein